MIEDWRPAVAKNQEERLRADPLCQNAGIGEASVPQQIGERRVWVISRYADVVEAFRKPTLFSSVNGVAYEPPAPCPTILELDPRSHASARRRVGRRFDRKAVGRLRPVIKKVVGDRLAMVKPGDDAVLDFAAHVPPAVALEILGIDGEHLPAAKKAIAQILTDDGASVGGSSIREIVRQWAAGMPAGLLADVLESGRETSQAADLDELTTWALVVLLGGQETTACAIGGSLVLLERFGAQKLVQHTGFESVVLDEMLRLISPTLYMVRTLHGDVTVGGQRMQAYDRAVLDIALANRDSSTFARPNEFRPGVHSKPPIAFGSGPHTCLGRWIAREMTAEAIKTVVLGRPDVAVDWRQADWDVSGNVRVLRRVPFVRRS